MKNCAILIPVYRKMNAYEKFSYNMLKDTVHNTDIFIVCGNSFDSSEFAENKQCFDDSYFKSMADYSRLCKSYEFYDRFSDYKYILIYQLDCLIFRDDIDYWCEQGYDYIGGPIVSRNAQWDYAPVVGNGGFSLRKVDYFKSITDPNGDFRKKYDLYLNLNRKKDLYETFEDLYFCEFVNNHWLFDVPTIEDGVHFSLDMNPDILYNVFKTLPMGCHAYCKNIPFWEKLINLPEEVKDAAYKEHGEFMEKYYKRQK